MLQAARWNPDLPPASDALGTAWPDEIRRPTSFTVETLSGGVEVHRDEPDPWISTDPAPQPPRGHARARGSCGIDVTHRHHRQPRPRQSAPLTQSCENAEVHGIGGLGGTWLLNTIGGSLEKQGRADNVSVVFAVWAAVVLKVIAAVVARALPR